MKNQKVIVIVNDIESNGIISLKDNAIYIDMGITNQIIDFRDIAVYDKKKNSSLGIILKNNKSIDLVFDDYLLLYKIIDDFMKKQNTSIKKGQKCPECDYINAAESTECSNCGFPLKTKKAKKKVKRKLNKKKFIILLIIYVAVILIIGLVYYFNEIRDNTSTSDNNNNNSSEKNENKGSTNTKNIKVSNSGRTLDYDATIKNRNMASTIFADKEYSLIEGYILLDYQGGNFRCMKIGGDSSASKECYEIDYIKNGEDVVIAYIYDSNVISFDCKETNNKLICYMDDGVTEYASFTKEK